MSKCSSVIQDPTHWLHVKGFLPVWVRRCVARSCLVNALWSQMPQTWSQLVRENVYFEISFLIKSLLTNFTLKRLFTSMKQTVKVFLIIAYEYYYKCHFTWPVASIATSRRIYAEWHVHTKCTLHSKWQTYTKCSACSVGWLLTANNSEITVRWKTLCSSNLWPWKPCFSFICGMYFS